MSLANRIALISGGSKGIGAAIGAIFASQGASVWLLARNRERLMETYESLPRVNDTQKHAFITHDVSLPKMLTTGEDTKFNGELLDLQRVNILVNAAGITETQLVASESLQNIQNIVNTNLLGTVMLTKSLLRPMIKSSLKRSALKRKIHSRDCEGQTLGGSMDTNSIINISSILSEFGIPGSSVYSATKAAVNAFTRSLALEVGNNIHVNALSLGLVDTTMAHGLKQTAVEQLLNASLLSRDRQFTDLDLGWDLLHEPSVLDPEDVARVCLYMIKNAELNGKIIELDNLRRVKMY